ncbi:5'-methylthioadenosine/adenosylhomocysteine nucleosidase [Oceanirhabdus seepicola]|uniref:adenosylhomocysteine nucleosidase n=1 Tax=Oceanirhabdus seepicola TaxID=2828781 RepID=A0A9J6PEG0_9CLOT|nr:5'-methylthioadenosine/adenosylhomocysteine nucleosidase [Oceanirhabdus seepicola]MCM1992720.1 5'-methylthioadenosine/adenosylhomocysteine nucleosidase [Oceanirhabdus seepicola]
MIVGIIGAMKEEVEILVSEMEIERIEKKAKMEFNYGTFQDKKVVIVTSGIGKVNAAVCTQILIDDFNVNCVINVGIAGGLKKDIFPGDVVVATDLVQHDMDTTFFGDKLGQIPRLDTFDFRCDERLVEKAYNACKNSVYNKYEKGRIVSGDQFISSGEKLKALDIEFNAYACEMEGASIAQVAYLNNIPFVVIRSISDNAINGTHMDYEKFSPIAIQNSTKILRDMLKNM